MNSNVFVLCSSVFLMVAISFVDCATVASTDYKFDQLNATIFQLGDLPARANWQNLPFSSPIVQVFHDASSDRFVLYTSANTVWLLDSYSETFVPSTAPQLVTDGSCRAVSSYDGYATTVLFFCGSTGIISDCRVYANAATSNLSLNCTYAKASSFARSSVRVQSIATQFFREDGKLSVHRALVIGTNAGLLWYRIDNGETFRFNLKTTNGAWSNTSNITNVFCLPYDVPTRSDRFFGGQCFAASNEGVIQYNDPTNLPMDLVHIVDGTHYKHYIRIPGVIDRRPEGATYDRQRDAVHFANRQCVNIMYSTGELQRVEGVHGGLPQHNLTSAAASSASTTNIGAMPLSSSSNATMTNVWFGSLYGAMLLKPNGKWKYLYGPRWLPGQGPEKPYEGMHVLSLAANSNVAVVATTTGLSLIRTLSWTLAEKNEHFQRIAHRHNRWGLATRNALKTWGNVYEYYNESGTANDGLWSSLRLSAEVFRYMTTKSDAAKRNCWQVFEGMELLFNVTGIRGYPARTLQPFAPPRMNGWRVSTTMPGWYWNGNTSSDEITGHLQTYPLMHDIVAETPSEKARVRRLIEDVTSHIVDHGYILIGEDGRPTRWGFWDPMQTNDDIHNYDERGLNSMELLGYLSSAYRITKNETYKIKFDELVDKHGYGDNLINLKISQPNDVDYSDDELTYSSYMCFYWSGQPGGALAPGEKNPLYEKVKVQFERSAIRTWNYVKKYKPSIWAAMMLFMFRGQEAVYPSMFAEANEALRWCLETYPTSMVTWPTNNADRLDVQYSIHGNRHGVHGRLLTTLLPYDEITLVLWNGDPFDKSSGGGWQEQDPSAFLYPYWIARYLGYV